MSMSRYASKSCKAPSAKHANMMLSIIEAEHYFESENNFDAFEPTRHTRFLFLEFIGTFCHCLISAGPHVDWRAHLSV